jgi:putative NADPH-quinone reductase
MSDGGELAEVLRRIFERPRSEVAPGEILGVLGTSNNDGNTAALTAAVFAPLPNAGIVNLSALSIAPYDYQNRHDKDDFLPLAEKLVAANAIVFASPVYWYSMSAQMKVFFDRLTDLTGAHKGLGKALAGKSAFLIATGGSPLPPASFEPPFSETARYFNMRWGGMLYQPGDAVIDAGAAKNFANRIADGVSDASVRAA